MTSNKLSELMTEFSGVDPGKQRMDYIGYIASQLDFPDDARHGLGVDIPPMGADVGADDQQVVDKVLEHRAGILQSLAWPEAA
jgi:hypothetical protein